MDGAKEQFLQIVGDYIHGRSTHIEPDTEKLCLYANQHQLASVVYAQTKLPELLPPYALAVSDYVNRKHLCQALLERMHESGITAFPIKGAVIASCYPQPALRTAGDSDIAVSDLDAAHRIMLESGYESISKNAGREWQYCKNGLEFELHDRLVFDEAINDERITQYLNDFWPYVTDNALDISFHFVYIMAHLRKHLMNAGVGFRQFLDIAMLAKNCPDLDWGWIEGTLNAIGLYPFAQTVFAFLEYWWDVASPFQAKQIDAHFAEIETDFIFRNGVFGFNNPDNVQYLASNRSRIDGKYGMIKRAAAVLFPSYDTLCGSPKYRFLVGKPILIPFAWMIRIVRGIFGRDAKAKIGAVTRNFVSKDYIQKREERFCAWGLADCEKG